jgi:hypothetical protein
MIGTCKIPLRSLVSGCTSHDKYPIYPLGGHTSAGQLEVKISVIEVDRINQDSLARSVATELHYGKEWESDLILRIARALVKCNKQEIPVGLLFGVFSRGMRTCTKEDFKYCCLVTLGLKSEVSERELDLFLMGNSYFKEQNYIEKDDFITVFESALQ